MQTAGVDKYSGAWEPFNIYEGAKLLRAHMTSGSIKKNEIHHQAALVSVSLPHPRESQICSHCLLCLTTAMSTPQPSPASKPEHKIMGKRNKERGGKTGGRLSNDCPQKRCRGSHNRKKTRQGSSNNSGTLPGKMK